MVQIVAKWGYAANLLIAGTSIEITQNDFVDLAKFTQKEIDESNLAVLMSNGWVEIYEGQELLKRPELHRIPKIPQVAVAGSKSNQVKVSIEEDGRRMKTTVHTPKNLPGMPQNQGVASETIRQNSDDTTAKLTEKDLLQSLKVGGRKVEKFIAPKIKKNTTINLDGQN